MELKVNQYLDVITMCFPIGDLLPEGINGPVSIATAGLMKDFKTYQNYLQIQIFKGCSLKVKGDYNFNNGRQKPV